MTAGLTLRAASHRDIPDMQALIKASVRGLSVGFYEPVQIEAAIQQVFGVDTTLIDDGTYYVIEHWTGSANRIVAAGGWSARRTLFGGDQMKGTADPLLDVATEPARIRAFFVHPDMARRGLARLLFAQCENAARTAGFREFVLMATLPGQPLYRSLGFVEMEAVQLPMAGGVVLPLVRMTKALGSAC